MICFVEWMIENDNIVMPVLMVVFGISVVIAIIFWVRGIIKVRRFLKSNKGKKIKDTTW